MDLSDSGNILRVFHLIAPVWPICLTIRQMEGQMADESDPPHQNFTDPSLLALTVVSR